MLKTAAGLTGSELRLFLIYYGKPIILLFFLVIRVKMYSRVHDENILLL